MTAPLAPTSQWWSWSREETGTTRYICMLRPALHVVACCGSTEGCWCVARGTRCYRAGTALHALPPGGLPSTSTPASASRPWPSIQASIVRESKTEVRLLFPGALQAEAALPCSSRAAVHQGSGAVLSGIAAAQAAGSQTAGIWVPRLSKLVLLILPWVDGHRGASCAAGAGVLAQNAGVPARPAMRHAATCSTRPARPLRTVMPASHKHYFCFHLVQPPRRCGRA